MWQRPIVFRDRRDAGRRLAEALTPGGRGDLLVLALPRGGVPVGYEVAQALRAPLDVVLVRKIGAPGNPEFGLGAVVDGPDPQTVLNDEAMARLDPPAGYVEAEIGRQLAEIERRRGLYRGSRAPEPVSGRDVVLVDDGIATGGTARAALRALAKAGARHVTLAVPVAPPDVLESLRGEADEVVCLAAPADFRAVGLHYENFDQTTDEEVVRLLDEARAFAQRPAG